MSNNCETQINVNFNVIIQCLVINAKLSKRTNDQCRLSKLDERLT